MGDTSISWTDKSWNPVTGCTKVSPGCKHCYAETFAERFRGVKGHPYEQGFDLKLWPGRLDWPLAFKKPSRIFVNSMSDLFHEGIPDEFIGQVFRTMAKADWHTFQVLTKRPERMKDWIDRFQYLPLPNVWLGVSVESQQFANERIPHLLKTPAAVRFVSCEPLLGPVDLSNLDCGDQWRINALAGRESLAEADRSIKRLSWVICGGESGAHARPMDLEWADDLRDQCDDAGVAFWMKQTGSVFAKAHKFKNKKGEDPEEWPEEMRVREFPR